jgi:signal transduction histidine kinase
MVLDVIEKTEDPVEKLTFIDMFKEATEKLSETIENLNEMITIKKNVNIKNINVNLKAEIEKIANAFQTKIAITHAIPVNLSLNIIPAYLENILQNLVTNAIKYKSPKRTPELEISYEANEDFHVISFKDNGLGINMDKNKHKLFGMYKTFHGNEDAKGIGLFIVKNQIEVMKGKIEAESEEGLGTTFKLYFNAK